VRELASIISASTARDQREMAAIERGIGAIGAIGAIAIAKSALDRRNGPGVRANAPFPSRRHPRPETHTRPKQPYSRPDARAALSEGGADGYLATYLAVVARTIDFGLSARPYPSTIPATREPQSHPTTAPVPPPPQSPRVDRAERRAFRGGAGGPTRHRMRGRACRRARSRRCEGRQTRSSQRSPFELPSATLAAYGPRRPTHAPDERSGDENPAVWRGEGAGLGLSGSRAACGLRLDGEVRITKKLTPKQCP